MSRPAAPVPAAPVPIDSHAAQGFALMAAAMLMMPTIDALAKILSASISPVQVTWGRFFFQMLLTAPLVVVLRGWRSLVPNRPLENLVRGVLIALASLFFFTAVKFMPLADTLAIFFIEPMILTILSAVVLKETVGWRRRVAVLVGFLGAMLVIRPSFAEVGAVALLPAGAAICFALYLLVTRKVAEHDSALTMQFVAGFAGTVLLSGMLAAGHLLAIPDMMPKATGADIWFLLLLVGLIATVGHLMVVGAFQRLPASILAGFQYLEIVSGTLLGLWLFGDFPDATTWAGIAVIIGSGLYIYWREMRTGRGLA